MPIDLFLPPEYAHGQISDVPSPPTSNFASRLVDKIFVGCRCTLPVAIFTVCLQRRFCPFVGESTGGQKRSVISMATGGVRQLLGLLPLQLLRLCFPFKVFPRSFSRFTSNQAPIVSASHVAGGGGGGESRGVEGGAGQRRGRRGGPLHEEHDRPSQQKPQSRRSPLLLLPPSSQICPLAPRLLPPSPV